jgi:hypothetical protein
VKIYFAGSIRGGRQDALIYSEIVALLRKHADVLTEHVGDIDHNPVETSLSDEAIYRRDMIWLGEADALVAEVTVPSHGVGYEIARAEALALPTLCVYRPVEGRRLSALIAGNPNLRCVRYESSRELDSVLATFLKQLGARAQDPA